MYLPIFEDHPVDDMQFALTGSITEQEAQPFEPLELDDEVVLVISGKVVAVNHKVKDGVVTRCRTVKVAEGYLAGPDGIAMIREARNRNADMARAVSDRASGQLNILDDVIQIDGVTGEIMGKVSR
jgi:hypothetical protein